MSSSELLEIQPEVAAALNAGKPVVALESSIISHGSSWPKSAETALGLEAEVRAHGALPATCAILHGRIKIGLTRDEIERLSRGGHEVAKVSRRDIGILVASGGTGATTLSATMIMADLAGIRVVSAGGLGGVHRGAHESFDISADLQELARTPVALVCAGIKSILDIRLTLEYLETHGVPVIGYRTANLPGYFSRDSGFGVDVRLDDPQQIARVMKSNRELGLNNGIVVANPIPEPFALPREVVDLAIEQALAEADAEGIAGKAVTPFLISRVDALTGGSSGTGSVQLGLNNARLAAAIAVAYAALANQRN
ncbi:pseudouridine-5-phosphate glycosidase [Paraburkholderia acidicola]|uniref:Pseudouridine-5'-phosphate glycosidase n=1 Tax=Paraburkholderia acidicola TaxID=1912599 RepID=A0A2A4F2R5_9BURK|nr:pseudouridine-5'-phosphate glycosidase [Paraburkholderia acidicola]PCE26938.1 pseudouridine-5-phosphate glycosidase [Paraburkholderia acidicola]